MTEEQEKAFFDGVETGRLLEKIDQNSAIIEMDIRAIRKKKIYEICVASGYIPRFTEQPYNWFKLEAIKMGLDN